VKARQFFDLDPLGLSLDEARVEGIALGRHLARAGRALPSDLDQHIGTEAAGWAFVAHNLARRVARCGRRADA
jgi:hypothetical protein